MTEIGYEFGSNCILFIFPIINPQNTIFNNVALFPSTCAFIRSWPLGGAHCSLVIPASRQVHFPIAQAGKAELREATAPPLLHFPFPLILSWIPLVLGISPVA